MRRRRPARARYRHVPAGREHQRPSSLGGPGPTCSRHVPRVYVPRRGNRRGRGRPSVSEEYVPEPGDARRPEPARAQMNGRIASIARSMSRFRVVDVRREADRSAADGRLDARRPSAPRGPAPRPSIGTHTSDEPGFGQPVPSASRSASARTPRTGRSRATTRAAAATRSPRATASRPATRRTAPPVSDSDSGPPK